MLAEKRYIHSTVNIQWLYGTAALLLNKYYLAHLVTTSYSSANVLYLIEELETPFG